jgi:hypothetical protein
LIANVPKAKIERKNGRKNEENELDGLQKNIQNNSHVVYDSDPHWNAWMEYSKEEEQRRQRCIVYLLILVIYLYT